MTPSRANRSSWTPYVVMGIIVLACLAVAASRSAAPSTAEERINAVAETIKCPTCQGESVADSNAPSSREIRADIADRLTNGQSGDEIRSSYRESYGEAILLTPSASGVTSIVWMLPVLALAASAAGLFVAFRTWRPSVVRATDDDTSLVQHALAERSAEDATADPS